MWPDPSSSRPRRVVCFVDAAHLVHCSVLEWLAQEPRIELLTLPPNFNLIERLGKFVRREALARRYHDDIARFKAATFECSDQVEGTHRPATTSRLTLEFQTIEEPQIRAAQTRKDPRRGSPRPRLAV
jgi:hypothetical protein